jgi:hypothetical protein
MASLQNHLLKNAITNKASSKVLSDSYQSYLFITDDVIGADDTVPIQFAGNLLTSLRDVLQHMKNKIITQGISIYTLNQFLQMLRAGNDFCNPVRRLQSAMVSNFSQQSLPSFFAT